MMAATSEWLGDKKIETALIDMTRLDMTALLALEAEQSGLLDLTENLSRIGHWWISLPDYTVTWSAGVYEIHGVTPAGYTPELETAIDFYHPDDRDIVASVVEKAVRDGSSFEFSLRLIRADGELRHVKSRGLTMAASDQSVAQVFGVFVDVTDELDAADVLREENAKLERIAYIDALTGLANRRQFDSVLQREWLRAAREQTALSLIMLDIDRFKRFNDIYGHPSGDDCLRIVAAAVVADLRRPADLMARYGGEEFVVILPVTETAGALKVANSVRAAIEALGLTHGGNHSCGNVVTASLGVATAFPQRDAPGGWLELIHRADAMLYEAKRTGRNKVFTAADLGRGGGAGRAPLPANEAARLIALAEYERNGATRRSVELDRIARLAATLTSCPIGLVTLVAQETQYFAGNFGMEGIDSTSRDVSFCAHTILGEDPFVVADASQDNRFRLNALVTSEFGLRYYAGAPIVSETTGHRLGALCVIDKAVRTETSPAQRAVLTDLAKMAAKLLEEEMGAARTAAGH